MVDYLSLAIASYADAIVKVALIENLSVLAGILAFFAMVVWFVHFVASRAE